MPSPRPPAVVDVGRPPARGWAAASPRLLAGLLAAAGATHLVRPDVYSALIPHALGPARPWVLGSGVAELVVGACLAVPRTRRTAALSAAALFVAVFPGNVKMAVDWSDRSLAEQVVAYLRLPVQLPLVLWAWGIFRRER